MVPTTDKSKDGTVADESPAAGHAVPAEPADHPVGVRVPATSKPYSDADSHADTVVDTHVAVHVGLVVKVAGRRRRE